MPPIAVDAPVVVVVVVLVVAAAAAAAVWSICSGPPPEPAATRPALLPDLLMPYWLLLASIAPGNVWTKCYIF